MKRPDARFPFHLRVPSTDVAILDQIYIRQQYEFEVKTFPGVIVDAGANIGLASIYFANRFPGARILAIEPEESNFALLQRNILPYPEITGIRAALWHKDEMINVLDPGLGSWQFMTQAEDSDERTLGETIHQVQGMSIDTLMRNHEVERLDILKIDVEGAEREVFNHSSSWVEKVDALIVELHERLKPGCARSFYSGTSGFDDEWWEGENIYLTRRQGCLVSPSA